MVKSSTPGKVILLLLAIIIGGLVITSTTEASSSSATIYPVERLGFGDDVDYGLPERQRVALYLRGSNSIETLTISTSENSGSSELYSWVTIEPKDSRISKLTGGPDDQLYITYQGKTIFSTHDLIYDYIHFNSVCTGPDKRQKLLFSMVRGGSANGEIQDMLFVYYDPVTQAFQHKVIERRYLTDVCEMESAQANKAEQEQLLKEVNLIHEKLRPSIDDTAPREYVVSQQALPTRQFSNTQLEAILAEFKQLIPDEPEREDEVETGDDELEYEYSNFYEPTFIVKDIVKNVNWRIVEVLYLQLYTSWGVLLAENKNTSQWTSFYTISGGGDSKHHLYFNDEVKLVDNALRGNFTAYGDQKLVISLNDFTVKNASRTKQ